MTIEHKALTSRGQTKPSFILTVTCMSEIVRIIRWFSEHSASLVGKPRSIHTWALWRSVALPVNVFVPLDRDLMIQRKCWETETSRYYLFECAAGACFLTVKILLLGAWFMQIMKYLFFMWLLLSDWLESLKKTQAWIKIVICPTMRGKQYIEHRTCDIYRFVQWLKKQIWKKIFY